MFSCEYCGIFTITYFKEHLQTTASLGGYFDTTNLKQSGFCTVSSLRILVSEQKYENNLNDICLCNVLLRNPMILPRFESENLYFLNLYSVHAARILDLSLEVMLSPPK